MRQKKEQFNRVDSGILLDDPQITLLGQSAGGQFLLYFFLIVLGLIGMFGWFYTSFPISLSVWLVVGAGAAYSVLFTWLFLLERRRNLWTAIVLMAGLGLFLLFLGPLEQGFCLTYNEVVQVYANASGLLFVQFPTEAAAPDKMTLYRTAFAIALLFVFSLLLGWLLIRRKSLMGCLLICLPFAMSSLVYTIIPSYGAIACMVAFLTFLLLNRATLGWGGITVKEGKRLYRIGTGQGQLRSLLLLPVLLSCLMALLALFPQAEYQRPYWADRLRSAITGQGGLSYLTDNTGAGGFTDRIDLERMGDLQFTGETILQVQTSKGEVDYLKGFVGSVYTGQSWEALTTQDYTELAGLLGDYKTQNFPDWFAQLLPCQADQDAYRYQISVINVSGDPRSVYTPYGLSSRPSELAGLQFVNDGVLRSSNPIFGVQEYTFQAVSLVWNHQFLSLRQRISDNFTAISPQNGSSLEALGLYDGSVQSGEYAEYDGSWTASEQLLDEFPQQSRDFAAAAQAYQAFVYEHYTQLPDELRSTLKAYLERRGVTGETAGNPWQAAQLIGQLLAEENGYSLTPGATPEGEDFIKYFLTKSHRGYCVHFASAATALLRAMDIPARYVGGFVIPSDGVSNSSGWMNIADSQAHAWVELYLSGEGWIPVEVTPGRENGEAADQIPTYEPSVIPEESSEPEETSEEPEEPAELTSSSQSSGEESLPESSQDISSSGEISASEQPTERGERILTGFLWILLWLLLVLLAIAVLLLFRKKQFEAQRRRFLQNDRNKGALEIYSYLLRLYRFRNKRLGSDGQLPQQLSQLVLKARFSQHMLTEQEYALLLNFADQLADETQKKLSLFRRFEGRYIELLF